MYVCTNVQSLAARCEPIGPAFGNLRGGDQFDYVNAGCNGYYYGYAHGCINAYCFANGAYLRSTPTTC
jgi:hypothetical protein